MPRLIPLCLLCRAKAGKAAAADAAHIGTDMESNMEEAEQSILPSGIEPVVIAVQGKS